MIDQQHPHPCASPRSRQVGAMVLERGCPLDEEVLSLCGRPSPVVVEGHLALQRRLWASEEAEDLG
jgi:hypothetical protein